MLSIRALRSILLRPLALRAFIPPTRLAVPTVFASVRCVSFARNPNELRAQIEKNIINSLEKVSKDIVIDAVRACKSSSQMQEPLALIQKILESDKVVFDETLLRELFLLRLPTSANIALIRQFYVRNPGSEITKSTALIPFRYCLFEGDLKDALVVTDLTTGHPNYIKKRSAELRSGIIKVASTAIGITLFSKLGVQALIDEGILADSWRHLSSINAMIITYLLNSSFFVTIVRFGRQMASAGGDYVTWQKGTFYTHWYKHADEMMMCARIMEADIAINGGGPSGGAASPELVEELCRTAEQVETHTLQPGYTRDGKRIRLLEPRDNLEDLKMQAYWMSGGDGFEWVEPDQDPATIMWKQHLRGGQVEGDSRQSLKWADEVTGHVNSGKE